MQAPTTAIASASRERRACGAAKPAHTAAAATITHDAVDMATRVPVAASFTP
jgi:hypothetical protein